MIEKELKFKVQNLEDLFKKLKGAKAKIFYCKDEIFGKKNINYRIRKRTIINNKNISILYEKTTPIKNSGLKTVKEEKVDIIPKDFSCGCSYEKIRYVYKRNNCDVTIDIYPIGIFCEIEGEENKIKKLAKYLGFNLKDNIRENVDTLYCQWAKKEKRKELIHWGFGKL